MDSKPRISLIVAVALAAAAVCFKAFLISSSPDNAVKFGGIAYTLGCVVAIWFGLQKDRIVGASSATLMTDLKAAFRPAAVFALSVALVSFFYYSSVNPGYFEDLIQQRVELAENANLEEVIPKDHPKYGISREQFVEDERKTAEWFYSAKFHTIYTLVGFLLMGGFYSFFSVLILRKFLRR